MDKKSLQELTGRTDLLRGVLVQAAAVAHRTVEFEDRERLNYYKSFPQIADKHAKLQKQLSSLMGRLGSFVGIEPGKALISMDRSVEILDQYTDNVEILMKKNQEEQQRLRVKKGKQEPIQPLRPQKLWNLSHPERKEKRHQVDLETINTSTEVTQAKSLPLTKLTYINTVPAFQSMIKQLQNEKEIAVDLEHSELSYHGFTCLMQLSTRDEDFIVDVFSVWKEMNSLNCVFNNPAITKVFHGAYMDIMWLHRDFDLRVAGLFDTYHAAKAIGHATKSYAYLLKHYTGVDTNKEFQKADWRVRPLTEDMLLYARIDTHYLLEIYDRMKADLLKRSVETSTDYVQNLKSVFNVSDKEVASIEYEGTDFRKSRYYLETKQRFAALQPPNKVQILDTLFELRDAIAKTEDIKSDEILPNKYLFELCDKKKFDLQTITHCLRKSPEILHKYFGRISRQLEALQQRQLEAKIEEEDQSIQQPAVSHQPQRNRVHEVKFGDTNEAWYFEFEKVEVGFQEYPYRTITINTKTAAPIVFEDPFAFMLSKYPISLQETTMPEQQPIQQAPPTPTVAVQELVKEEVLYFPKDKKRPREAPAQPETAFVAQKPSKKQKKQLSTDQQIKTSANPFSYLQ